MEISFSSILSSVLATSLLTCLLFVVIWKKNFVTRFGLGCMYFLLILILVRGFLPLDFTIGLTTTLHSRHVLPRVRDFLLTELFSFHQVPITPMKILLLLWLTGSIVCAYRTIKSYLRTKKDLESSPQVTDDSILSLFQDALDATFPIQKPVFQLVQNDSFGSPALFGICKPIIVLPNLEYSKEELYPVFRHELLHYKHKDYIFRMLANILSIIYWWNLLLSKLLFSLTSQIQELWVDFHISQTSNNHQKANYLRALFTTLQHSPYDSMKKMADKQMLLLTDDYDKACIKQRFEYVKANTIKSFSIYGIIMCIALFISSFTFVLEPLYDPSTDENGQPVFDFINDEIYFIKNTEQYDMYVNGEYMGTLDKIPETFKNVPIYNSQEEVP